MVEKRTVYIRFHAAINFNTINNLTTTIQKKFDDGYEKFVLLISSVVTALITTIIPGPVLSIFL